MTPAGSILILHSGALGDTILMLHFAERLHAAMQRPITLFTRGSYLPLTARSPFLKHIGNMDVGGFHTLFSDSQPIPTPLIAALGVHEIALNLLTGPDSTVSRRLREIGVRHVIELDPRPRPDFSGHIIDQWLADAASSILQMNEEWATDVHDRLMKRLAAASEPRSHPLFQIDARDVESARQTRMNLMQLHGDRTCVTALEERHGIALLHPGAGSTLKQWPLSNFVALARRLEAADWRTVFLLGPVEAERFSQSDAAILRATAPMLQSDSLETLAAALAASDVVIGNDSGVAHLAAAMGVHVMAIFGPTEPNRWKPLGPRGRVIHVSDSWPTVDAVFEMVSEKA